MVMVTLILKVHTLSHENGHFKYKISHLFGQDDCLSK